MDWKVFATVFGTVFLAELGDKTQLATLLFASKSAASLWTIFFAASAALVLTSAIGVAAGAARLAVREPEISLVRGRHRLHRHRRVDAVPSRRRRELTRRDSVLGLTSLFAAIYFVQSVGDPTSGLIAQPVRSLLDRWGESPASIATFMAVMALPWALKPLLALLSDFVPLFGSRRRNYLLVATAAAAIGLGIAYFAPAPRRPALAAADVAHRADARHRVHATCSRTRS